MASPPPSEEPSSRPLDRWGPWALALAALAVGFILWEGFPPGIWHDDGVYVMLGRALAQGEGLRYVGVVGEPLAPKFPPLYPLFLAGLWSLNPNFPDNTLLLGGANLVVLALAAALFAGFARKVLGLSARAALAAAALAWLSPELWRVALVPLSEPLFLVTLILAFGVAARLEERPGLPWTVLFLLVAGGAVYTRTLGAALLLAGALALLLRRRPGLGATTLLGGGALLLPWLLWSTRAAETIPGPLRDILGPYGSWWIREVVRAPLAYGGYLLANARQLAVEGLSLFLPGVTGPLLWLGLLLLPLLLLGFREMARRTLVLPLGLGISVGVLLLWPFQAIRLLVPFQPFLFLALLLGLRAVAGESEGRETVERRRRFSSLAGRVVGIAWVVTFVALAGYRLATGWPGKAYHIRSEDLVQAVRAVNEKTPPDAVVGAPELWPGIHLFTGRSVAPSARFLPLAEEGGSWGTPRAQYELWHAAGVTHLLVELGGRVHGDALDRMEAECGPGTVQVLNMVEGQFLVRLGWDEACRETLLGGGDSPGAEPGASRPKGP
jgi:hypothetical protein